MTQKGFSLIEILIVIIVMGIFAAFAYPQYNKHIQRTRILEGLAMSTPIKLDIQTFALKKNLSQIHNNASLKLPNPSELKGEFVSSIQVTKNGVIKIHYDEPAGTLRLTPTQSYVYIKWHCASESESINEYLPDNCTSYQPREEEPNES